MMEMENYIGTLASLSTLVMVVWGYPDQMRRILTTRSSRDLSLVYLGCSEAGWVFWLWYGILKRDWHIIAPNAVGLLLGAAVLVLYFRFRHGELVVVPSVAPTE